MCNLGVRCVRSCGFQRVKTRSRHRCFVGRGADISRTLRLPQQWYNTTIIMFACEGPPSRRWGIRIPIPNPTPNPVLRPSFRSLRMLTAVIDFVVGCLWRCRLSGVATLRSREGLEAQHPLTWTAKRFSTSWSKGMLLYISARQLGLLHPLYFV